MPSTIRGSDNFDSGRFESAEQTITAAGGLTIPHGLGVKPFMVQCELICKVAALGYSVGDIVIVQDAQASSSAADAYGLSLVYDSTNINIRMASGAGVFIVINKTTGAGANITATDWKLIVKAIA